MAAVDIANDTTVTARVLVVDADVLVRTEVARYLRECGFVVLEAGTAEEAIALIRAAPPVDVAFIDLGPPGQLDGFGLVQWIHRERPSIKTILTAGVQRTCEEASELCHHGPALQKPYDHGELERRIRQLLAK